MDVLPPREVLSLSQSTRWRRAPLDALLVALEGGSGSGSGGGVGEDAEAIDHDGNGLEDFLVNRAGSLVMIALVVPWLMRPQPLSVPGAWSALVRHARHPVRLSAPSATEPPSSGSTQ